MLAAVLAIVIAAPTVAPASSVTAEASPPQPSSVAVTSLPQLWLVGLDGRLGLSPRLVLELSGWSAFREDQGAFARGGFVGGQLTVLQGDGIDMVAGLRALAGQTSATGAAIAGLAGRAETHIAVSSSFSLHPSFDLTWFGPLVSGRLVNELAASLGDWRLGGQGGVQAWVRDSGAVQVGPVAALAVTFRHEFPQVALEVGGALGLSRDPSFLVDHPVLATPRDAVAFDAALRVAVTTR
jgi:hypothetical protein